MLEPEYDIVGSVTDGAAALTRTAQLLPDVLVLDLVMPMRNGLEVCERLSETLPDVKIVVLTADTDPGTERMARAAGAFAFVRKSTLVDHLLPALRLATTGRRAVSVP